MVVLGERMKILIYGLNTWPEPVGIGRYTGELSAWLAERGHEVRAIAAPPYFPNWRAGRPVDGGLEHGGRLRELEASAGVVGEGNGVMGLSAASWESDHQHHIGGLEEAEAAGSAEPVAGCPAGGGHVAHLADACPAWRSSRPVPWSAAGRSGGLLRLLRQGSQLGG